MCKRGLCAFCALLARLRSGIFRMREVCEKHEHCVLYAEWLARVGAPWNGQRVVEKDDGARHVRAGQQVDAPAAPAIFKFVEQMPAFKGDLNAYLSAKLRYPDDAREAGTEGRSVIQFIVNENGSISGVEVVRSSGSASLDAEAKRVVSNMPAWSPGKQQGKEVKVYFTLPVTFKLD